MPVPGTFLDRYYLIAPLAEGGMSEVYLAYDVPKPRFVALKFPRDRFRFDPSALGRIEREADVYRKLAHPTIVRLLGAGPMEGGGIFLAQEFLRGKPLQEIIEGIAGPLPVPLALAVLEDLAGGLQAAHELGIIHRDVQPRNVVIGNDLRGRLLDFGIAFADDGKVQTSAGTILGTLCYAAPEQRRGQPVDHRADVFSLGTILYEMLTGVKAIDVKTVEEAMEARVDYLPPPSRMNQKVPAELNDICFKLLADDPEERYPSMKAVLAELAGLKVHGGEALTRKLFGRPEEQDFARLSLAFRAGRLDEAGRLADELLPRIPREMLSDFFHLVGQLECARGRRAEARFALEESVSHAGDDLEPRIDLALFLLEERSDGEAKALLESIGGYARGNILVLGLIDAIQALPQAPPSVWQTEARPTGLLGSLKALFQRS